MRSMRRGMWLVAVAVLLSAAPAVGGTWHSFVHEKPRTGVEEFFRDLGDRQRNHVSPEGFLQQLNEHGGYDFRSLHEAEHYFATNDAVHVGPCRWAVGGIPPGVGILRTDVSGTQFDVWRREGTAACREGERFVYDGNVPVFSLYCGNVIVVHEEAASARATHEPVVCRKYSTPSYRHKYVSSMTAADFGGVEVGATRGGSLIETECFDGSSFME